MQANSNRGPNTEHSFLSGEQELNTLIRSYDWSQTPLGTVECWPQSLRSALSICLNSNFPIAIYWGKDLTLLYNTAWSPIPGNKHPTALGKAAREVWPEIWDELEPQFAKAFKGQPGGSKDALLPMLRKGYKEECYFDFTFTPIYGEEGTVEGIFNAVIETTYRIISERRASLLKNLAVSLAQSPTRENVYEKAGAFMKEFSKDIPFALFYTIDDDIHPRLASSTINNVVDTISWKKELPLDDLIRSGRSVHIPHLKEFLAAIPLGFWPELPVDGLIVPLKNSKGKVTGFIFFGLSARLAYDADYQSFLEGIGSTIDTVVQTIFLLELERKRSAELAEIDKAKTAFFTNISHEFRTPLTLLLGPTEELLEERSLDSSARERVHLVYRNALRMQKLVNTLLEFSRIEAGRMEAHFQLVDIAALTADFVSTFRSAVEKVGMELQMECAEITDSVYVDVDMWEKIVLNLVSNAFKYSHQGKIIVKVEQLDTDVEISVSDTGIGIAPDQLDKLFDRFQRVENSGGRSHEGSGIGLALVRELVKLHQGTIQAASEPGKGSVFTVSIPTGKSHLPPEKVSEGPFMATNANSVAYKHEADQWAFDKPDSLKQTLSGQILQLVQGDSKKYHVLLADDNPDMRDYLERLLSEMFVVTTARDGEDAYNKMVQHKPDILVSDIMMPKLDGFGLLEKVRQHPDLRVTPVIFLSAQAGEEAKVDGLNAGADDYLVKPFSSKELLVRVSNLIRINQVRRQTEQQFYQLFLQAPALINTFKGPDHVYELFHPRNKEIFGNVDFTGMKLADALPNMEEQGIIGLLDKVYHEGITVEQHERLVTFVSSNGKKEERYLNFIYQPWYDLKNNIQGVLNFAIDVTTQVLAQKSIEKSEQNLKAIITQAPVPMCIFRGADFVVDVANAKMLEFWGKSSGDVISKPVFEGLPEASGQGFEELLMNVFSTGKAYSALEMPVMLPRNGSIELVYVNFVYEALRESDGWISGVMAVAIEVTEQVIARKEMEAAEEKARLAIESAELGTYHIDMASGEATTSERFNLIWGTPPGSSWEELLARIHPDDHDLRSDAQREAAVSGQLHYEARILWTDQTVHWVRVNGRVLFGTQGTPSYILGVIQDISEQKRFASELRSQVQQRTQQLSRSNQDLQQFAHVASHDLKEPVRKIKVFSGRLEKEFAGQLPEKARTFISKIQGAADRMNLMIEGVLTYSSMNANEQPVQSVNIEKIIAEIQEDMEILIAEKQAVISVLNVPVVEGATVLIYQLFYNLINNALKFSKAGEPVLISISADADPTDQNFTRIVVSDNGIGFKQESAQKVFETFIRLNAKDEFEGTGLGLSLCKKIVERHGGSIIAQSAPNLGATFILTLPFYQTRTLL
jgi:PAS domain S-box-containing protein